MTGVILKTNFKIKPFEQAVRKLAAASSDLSVPFADIGEHLLISHDQRFKDQVTPDGIPWEPLNEKYARRKKRNADRILFLDGMLAGQLRYVANPDQFEFGTNRIYAATHHFGRREAGIPERPWLGISPDDETQINRIIGKHLERALASSPGGN